MDIGGETTHKAILYQEHTAGYYTIWQKIIGEVHCLLFELLSLPVQSLDLRFEAVHLADEGAVLQQLILDLLFQLILVRSDSF